MGPCQATEGVKQGGPISPFLYKDYTYPILIEAEKTELGIKLATKIITSVGYADDLAGITDETKKCQELDNVFSKEGTKLEIKFNPKKSFLTTNDN